MSELQPQIGLALSGGGVRAMAFHCGVLRWLAETRRIESITQVSSVSGGSLFIGQVLSKNNWEWPSSDIYFERIHPEIKRTVTTVDLQCSAVKRLLRPSNWRYLLSRANVLSQSIEHDWGVAAHLGQLPASPVWSVNGTTAETGKRFRFKRDGCGDYEVGYASASDFKVADALAVSAAFPLGIGPFVIRTAEFKWSMRGTWGKASVQDGPHTVPFKRLHLYDGGVYDNLGLEPLFDIGKQELKTNANYLVVSDAGLPLEREFSSGPLSPFRLKRVSDITMDQTRSLRIRALSNYLIRTPNAGVYLQIGVEPRERIAKYRGKNEEAARKLLGFEWLSSAEIERAAFYETTLHKLTVPAFDGIERHGYETAKWNESLFSSVPLSE